jgi:tetratricopeptide (TPR) repeat protein
MFSLLALLLYVRAAKGAGRGWMIGAAVAYAAALLSKPSAATVPLLAAIIDRLLIGRPWRAIAVPVAVGCAMAVPIVIVNRSIQVAVHASALPLAFRLALPGDTLTHYLCKLLLPMRLGLQYPLRPPDMIHHAWAYAAWVVTLGVAVILWRSKRRWLWAAGLIFAVAPLPVLGWFPFDWQWYAVVADHYLYVALLGPAVAMAYALAGARRPWAYGVAAAYLAVLAALSFRQAGFWADNATLARHALDVNPRSFVAHTLLGAELVPTDPQGAVRELRAAFEIEPNYVTAAGSLKQLLDQLGRPDEARAVMIRSVAANEALPPGQQLDATESYRLLAHYFESHGDPARAAEYYRKLLSRRPNDADARAGLARVAHAPATRP